MAGLRTAQQYRAQLRALLPAGPAWEPERVPELALVLTGLSQELARIEARAFALLNEMDAGGVNELVPDWERVMGLPDPCIGLEPVFEDRRLAVCQRLTADGGQGLCTSPVRCWSDHPTRRRHHQLPAVRNLSVGHSASSGRRRTSVTMSARYGDGEPGDLGDYLFPAVLQDAAGDHSGAPPAVDPRLTGQGACRPRSSVAQCGRHHHRTALTSGL